MEIGARVHAKNLRVSLQNRETFTTATLHELGDPWWKGQVTLFLHSPHEIEIWQRLADDLAALDQPEPTCPRCGAPLEDLEHCTMEYCPGRGDE